MEARKNPKYDLRQYKSLFFNIGLVVSLLMVIGAFEWRFYEDEDIMSNGASTIDFVETMDIPVTEQPPPPPPKALKNIKIIAVEDIEEIEEEIQINLDIEMTEDLVVEKMAEIIMEEVDEEEYDEIFVIVEQNPVPKGGMAAFYTHVYENIKYPRQAQTLGIEGKVFIQFVVGKDGKLTDITVIRGIGGGCDEEAIRVIKNAPNWKAGKQRGRPVRVKMVLPITFRMVN